MRSAKAFARSKLPPCHGQTQSTAKVVICTGARGGSVKKFGRLSGVLFVMVALIFTRTTLAQQHGGEQHSQPHQAPQQHAVHEQGVGGGHIPQHGPAPVHTPAAKPPQHQPEHPEQRRTYQDGPGHPTAPHVHAENDHWVGHDPQGRSTLSSRSSLGARTLHRNHRSPSHLAAAWRQSRALRYRRILLSGRAI